MEDEEAFLDLQLTSEPPITAPMDDGDRWAQMEASLAQEQADEAARRRAAFEEAREGDEGRDATPDENDASDGDYVSDEDGRAADGEPTGGSATGGATDVTDEQLLAVTHKKDAKSLGKALYKRWKKLHKSGHSSSKDKKKKKSRKETHASSKRVAKSSGAKTSKSSSGEKKSKRIRGVVADSDDTPFVTEDEANRILMSNGAAADTLGVSAARRTAGGGARARRDAAVTSSNKRLTAAQQRDVNAQIAAKLVAEMRQAAQADEAALLHPERGARPLFRVALSEKVNALCRRECLYGPLVGNGILQELSQWLYSIPRNEPAPFQLRTIALDVLLNMPIIGEVRAKHGKKNRDGELVFEDLTQFLGIEWEHLRETDLGVAVNSLRQHANETPANRAKCIRLLERLSRARHNDEDGAARQSSSGPAQVYWRAMDDTTVASPFVTVQTGSEAFQKAIMKPDPRDPTSYDNYLPWRPAAVPVTNLSGDLVRVAKGRVGNALRSPEK